jgi:hypothetical protein
VRVGRLGYLDATDIDLPRERRDKADELNSSV